MGGWKILPSAFSLNRANNADDSSGDSSGGSSDGDSSRVAPGSSSRENILG